MIVNIFSSNFFLILIDLILIFFIYKRNINLNLLSPTLIIPTTIFILFALGNLNLFFFQTVIGWYQEINPSIGNRVALLGLLVLNIILLFKKPSSKISKNIYQINRYKFDILIYSISFIAILLNILNFSSIGGILIFKDNLNGYERFDIMDKLPFPKGLIMSSFILCPLIIRIILLKDNRVLLIILFIVNGLLAFGLGQRHFIFMPLITALFFLYSINKISTKIIFLGSLMFPILIIFTSLVRGDGQNIAYSSYSSIFGNEYRDYLRLRNEPIPLQYGKTIAPVLLNAIPKQFYSVAGLDKQDYSVYSAYLLADYWGNQSGQRTGIWGEFYLNFGDTGLILCFIFFGFLLLYIEKQLFIEKFNLNTKFIASYFYSLLIFSIIASWASIGDDIGSFGIMYILFYLLAFSKPKKFILINNNTI